MAHRMSEVLIYSDVTEGWEDTHFFNNCGRIAVLVYKQRRYIITPNPYLATGEPYTIAWLERAGFRRDNVVRHGIGSRIRAAETP